MMLVQIIIFKKCQLTNLNQLFLHKELFSLDEFIHKAAINQSIQNPLKDRVSVGIKRLQCIFHLPFELEELFNAFNLITDRLKALLISESLKMADQTLGSWVLFLNLSQKLMAQVTSQVLFEELLNEAHHGFFFF